MRFFVPTVRLFQLLHSYHITILLPLSIIEEAHLSRKVHYISPSIDDVILNIAADLSKETTSDHQTILAYCFSKAKARNQAMCYPGHNIA